MAVTSSRVLVKLAMCMDITEISVNADKPSDGLPPMVLQTQRSCTLTMYTGKSLTSAGHLAGMRTSICLEGEFIGSASLTVSWSSWS